MRFAASLLVLVLVASVARGEDKANEELIVQRAKAVVQYTRAILPVRKRYEALATHKLRKFQAGRVSPGQDEIVWQTAGSGYIVPLDAIFGSAASKQAHIDEAAREVAEIRESTKKGSSTYLFYGLLPEKLQVGTFGHLTTPWKPIKVHQVLGPERMVVARGGEDDRQYLLIVGIKTDGIVDGQKWHTPMPLEVTGTEMLRLATGGTNSLYKLEPLDTAPIEEYIREKKLIR